MSDDFDDDDTDPGQDDGASDDSNLDDASADDVGDDETVDNSGADQDDTSLDQGDTADQYADEDADVGVDLDEDVFGSRDEYPDATDEDFAEDVGDWTEQDYAASAQNLFGAGEYFGETAHDRYLDQGLAPSGQNQTYQASLEQYVPGAASTVDFYQRGDQIVPQGFISLAALALLARNFPQMDLSQLNVAVPPREASQPYEPQPLPPSLQNVEAADKVDLRKYCSPVDDQGQTSRCSAFAWTHAAELAGNVTGASQPRLSVNYSMLSFQKQQGEFRDYSWAYQGGEGTARGPAPGEVLVGQGTCRHDYWPNDSQQPKADERAMQADAQNFLLPASVQCIDIDDVRKVLTAGCPVHVAMNTGEAFADVGRDGLFNAAERPTGQHERRAMLIVGYISNYFIVKNSWGTDWGDQGYCYIPKKVLQDSEPDLVAVLLKRPATVAEPGAMVEPVAVARPAEAAVRAPNAATAPASVAAAAETVCAACNNRVPSRKFCVACGQPLARLCAQCGAAVPPHAKFCVACGTHAGEPP